MTQEVTVAAQEQQKVVMAMLAVGNNKEAKNVQYNVI